MAKRKINKNFYKFLSFILIILTVISSGFLIYFDVIPQKYLIILLLLLFGLVLFITYKLNNRNNLFTKIACSIVSIILIIGEIGGIFYANGTIDFFNIINDNGYVYENYGLYVKSNSTIKSVKELKNETIIAYFENDNSKKLALNKLESNIKYELAKSQDEAIKSTVDGKYKAIYLNKTLMDIYLEDNPDSFKLISSYEIKQKNESDFNNANVTKESFVVYLSGIDSYGKVNKSARSDVNLLAVVNPKSGKILLITTPRDYYVTLKSKNAKDKLTHAGIYGIEESAKTLGLLYDVDVNYYARVNFTSFVNIIDKLNGVTVNVEKPDYRTNLGVDCQGMVCEQDSKREFGSQMIYIKPGVQTLNGEEALAYVRNRHQYKDGDNARGRHQEEVLKAITEKAMSPSILTKYTSLLNALSSGVRTNMDQKTVAKLVNYQLDKNIKWTIESLAATGTDSYNTCYSIGKAKAYVMEPNIDSVNTIKEKIKETMNV